MNEKYELACEKDKQEILGLYKAQLGRQFCPWDEHYPGEKEIDMDLSNQALLILRNDAGEIIAAVSIDEDENVDKLPQWSKELAPGKEAARLAVRPDYQNQGLAQKMLGFAMEEIKKRGYKSIHFLVNKQNIKALRAYSHLNFQQVGEVFMYEQPFYCYEKAL